MHGCLRPMMRTQQNTTPHNTTPHDMTRYDTTRNTSQLFTKTILRKNERNNGRRPKNCPVASVYTCERHESTWTDTVSTRSFKWSNTSLFSADIFIIWQSLLFWANIILFSRLPCWCFCHLLLFMSYFVRSDRFTHSRSFFFICQLSWLSLHFDSLKTSTDLYILTRSCLSNVFNRISFFPIFFSRLILICWSMTMCLCVCVWVRVCVRMYVYAGCVWYVVKYPMLAQLSTHCSSILSLTLSIHPSIHSSISHNIYWIFPHE